MTLPANYPSPKVRAASTPPDLVKLALRSGWAKRPSVAPESPRPPRGKRLQKTLQQFTSHEKREAAVICPQRKKFMAPNQNKKLPVMLSRLQLARQANVEPSRVFRLVSRGAIPIDAVTATGAPLFKFNRVETLTKLITPEITA